MNRLAAINLHFSAPTGQKVQKKKAPKGNFKDAWAYLGMDEHITDEAKVIRDKCRAFAERYNAEVSTFHKTPNLVFIFEVDVRLH